MNLFFIATALIFSAVSYSFAQVVGITAASCGYLSKKGIYCFGGSTTTASLPATSILFLDTAKNNGSLTKDLANKWTAIKSNKNNVLIQAMDYPQHLVLGDGATMLINGGQNYGGMTAASKTVGYNADNNSWIAYPDFIEPPFATRQIFGGSFVYVPEYGVGFYGGREANKDPNWTINGQNISGYDASITGVRYIGYTKLTFFDIRKSNPWYEFPIQNNLPSTFIESQRSVFDPVNNKIFFLGGGYYDPERKGLVYESLKSATTFDLNSGTWGTQALGGIIPSARSLHTMTLLPSTNRDVLLYGGELGVTNCVDYLFTLNLDTYIWRQHLLSDVSSTELIRTGHSAALVNKTLFIVFGKNQLREVVSSVILLNVTDPSHITYLDTYIDPNQVPNPSNRSDSNPKSSPDSNNTDSGSGPGSGFGSGSSSGLSTGATVGIAVGGTIAGVAIILIAAFFLWKRNKNKKQSREDGIPEMEDVNWEEIEKKYEVASAGSHNNSKHPSPSSNNTITVTNNTTDINLLSTTRPDINNVSVRPDSNAKHLFQKPDGGI